MNRDETLAKAGELINGQRHQDYGDASKNFDDIAKLWSPILGIEVEPWRVALCMAQLKIARIFKTPDHEDSWLDGVGYLALGSELAAGAEAEPTTRWKVGDLVDGEGYGELPVGTVVNDPDDPSEGLITRHDDGNWGERDDWGWKPFLPRVIVTLPEGVEPLRVLDGNREVRA